MNLSDIPSSKQSLRARIPEEVSARTIHRDADPLKVFHDMAGQGESVTERPKGGDHRQKYLAVRTGGTSIPQVFDDGIRHGRGQGIRRVVPGLPSSNMQVFVPPVDVVQAKMRCFCARKP